MQNRKILRRAGRCATLAGAALFAGTACQDLAVENLLAPDRDTALGSATDVEAFMGAAFYPSFFRPVHGIGLTLSGLNVTNFTYTGADITSTLGGTTSAVYFLDLAEPRREFNNAATLCSTICEHGPRTYWAQITSAASVNYDGLQILDLWEATSDKRIMDGNVDVTPRARAFAKFMQAWTWGYGALIFDRIHVVPEDVDIPGSLAELTEFSRSTLLPYDEAVEAALESLDEAIAIAQANPTVVKFPMEEATQSIPWFGSDAPVTNAQFIQFANTLAARLMVLNARSPAERAALDWNRVLQYTANGITPGNDLIVTLDANRTSQVLQRLQTNDSGGATNARWNYHTIGMADQSGGYQAWISAPLSERDRFDITTPDRRITGETPTSNGSYTCYRADNLGFLAERGTYRFSAYHWQRHKLRNGIGCASATTGLNSGTTPMLTSDENALLRAEALLRTGDAAGAAAQINVTRTRTHLGSSLPPVTAAGVPEVGGVCVPRTDAGACGSLMTAIRYERLIEMAGTDAIRNYADSRGFGMLPDGSLQSFPVPGNILDQYGMQPYTWGGVGNPGSAVYAPAN